MAYLLIPWVLLVLAVLAVLAALGLAFLAVRRTGAAAESELAALVVRRKKGRKVLLLVECLILTSMVIINCRDHVFSFGAVINGSWRGNSELAAAGNPELAPNGNPELAAAGYSQLASGENSHRTANGKEMNDSGGTFKVMSFNVNGGSELFSVERLKVLIDAEDPDFLYLIECAWTEDVLDALDRYPFKVRTFDGIMASKSAHEGSSDMPGARCANVSYPGLTFFLCHLASNNSFKDEQGGVVYITPDRLADASSLRMYLENVEAQSAVRYEQAQMICEAFGGRADMNCDATNDSFGGQKEGALPANASEVSVVSHPTIVMGDMNEVSGSAALRLFRRSGLRDAWWTGGFGYGATYHEPLPFRIDHIYYSPELRLNDIRILRSAESIPLSDHDALVATFSFRQA